MKQLFLSFAFFSAVTLLFLAERSSAQERSTVDIPRTISYQGILSQTDGFPIGDGLNQIAVRLYADKNGSELLWHHTYQTNIVGGVFNLYLGSEGNPLPEPAIMNKPLWVGTSVNGTAEMHPLTPLSSSPYALNVSDNAVTNAKIAEKAVTAEKIDMDYISEVRVDGKKVTGKGAVLSFESGKDIHLNFNELTGSIMVERAIAGTGKGNKDPQVLGLNCAWYVGGDRINTFTQALSAAGATDWLGTGGAVTLDIRVNNTTAMRYQPNGVATPNVIGGSVANTIATTTSVGSVIGGGGAAGTINTIDGDYDVVAGGLTNTITDGDYNFIGSGLGSTIDNGNHNVIGGGSGNIIENSLSNFIGAGGNNSIDAGDGNAIAGGHNSTITAGHFGFIGGGTGHEIEYAHHSVISGGRSNRVVGSSITSLFTGTIGGGEGNKIEQDYATIGGGRTNIALGSYTTIPGGDNLQTSSSYAQTVIGYFNDPGASTAMPIRPTTLQTRVSDAPLFIIGNGDYNNGTPIRSNAFEVSYNGHSVVYDVNNTGATNSAIRGATYTDNIIYGWANVDANGELIGSCQDFGVQSIQHTGPGVYRVTLNIVGQDGKAATIDCGAVVATLGIIAEIDPSNPPSSPPSGISCAQIVTTQITNNMFDVFIIERSIEGTECDRGIDLPFKFHVTGRAY